MNNSKLYPLIVTSKLAQTRAFYLDQLGCKATHDMEGYLQVRFGADESAAELAFMSPKAAPPFGKLAEFSGEGLIVSVPTADADARHRELKGKKLAVLAEPSDKPWGWRSFIVADPNGVKLDFFHELADAPSANAAS
jgi:catechol 2,3-dioxygenase-like lactoylglutathione lyase family enzyme